MSAQVLCQYCQTENVAGASNCCNCGAPLPASVPGRDEAQRSAAFAKVAMPAAGLVFMGFLGVTWPALFLMGSVEHPHQTVTRITAPRPDTQNDQSGQSLAIFFMALQGVGSGLVLVGGIQMYKLKSYALARNASLLSLVPLMGPCCGIAFPFGIWSLAVLSITSVREQFG